MTRDRNPDDVLAELHEIKASQAPGPGARVTMPIFTSEQMWALTTDLPTKEDLEFRRRMRERYG